MGILDQILRQSPAWADKTTRQMYKRMLGNVSVENRDLMRQIEAAEAQERRALEKVQRPKGMQESNLVTAHMAGVQHMDPDAELLLAPASNDKAAASMIFRPGEHDDVHGIIPGSIYIEGLASEVPGGGTALLKELQKEYPGHAMHLESMSYPETLDFYRRKGFVEVPRVKGTNLIGGTAPFFIKPADVMIKKEGGSVKKTKPVAGGVPRRSEPLSLTVSPRDVEFGRLADEATAERAEALERHPMRIARRKADEAGIPQGTYIGPSANFVTPEQRTKDFEQRLEKGMIVAPAAGTAALTSGAWLGPAARMVVEGTKSPAAIAAMSGVGAGTEMLEDKPTALGALAKAAQWAAMTRMPISEALTYVPEAEAGGVWTRPAKELMSKFTEKLRSAKRPDFEHGMIMLPDGRTTGLIQGTADSVNFERSPIWRDATWYKGPQSWPQWASVHSHPHVGGETWINTPPSHHDWIWASGGVPKGGEHVVYHPANGVEDRFAVADEKELQRLGPRKLFDPESWGKAMEGMTLPAEFNDDGVAAILRALPLRLKSYGIVDVGNTGSPAENALLDQFAEDWGRKVGFAEGGSVQKFAGGGLALLRKALTGQMARDAATSNVIKEKGGNWLSGSVEGALSGLRKPEAPRYVHINESGQAVAPEYGRAMTAEELAPTLQRMAPNKALNSFIDKQLTRYVKNEMATPEDPVRALAERGVLHSPVTQTQSGVTSYAPANNVRDWAKKIGSLSDRLGVSDLAKSWENAADSAIDQNKIGSLPQFRKQDWMVNASPDAIVNDIRGNTRSFPANLGFDHLIDELSNALNPESGLPRHLLLDPKSLERVSVPQAVERVAKINEWRAAQKAEADAKLANNAATVLYKEYPDKGMKWVELRPAEQLNPEYELKQIQGKNGSYWDLRKPGAPYGHTTNTELEAIRASNREALEQALKYEGDTMGHCVGGYCDDVASGRTKIYSLRDAKGQPHVTVEVRPPRDVYPVSGEAFAILPQETKDRYRAITADWRKRNPDDPDVWKALAEAGIEPSPPSIVQIKGKQNRAPNPEYLPMVQDFVKSGQWSDVGDLQNAGLQDLRGFADEPMAKAAREKLGNYATREEWDAFANTYVDNKSRGYASGGSVKNNLPDFTNPAIINAIFKELQ